MKKYILSLFIAGFTLISFSSASSVSTNCNNKGCSVCDYISSYGSYCCFNIPSNTEKVIISGKSPSQLSLNGRGWGSYTLPYTANYSDTLVPCIAYGYGSTQGDYTIEFVPSPIIPGGSDGLTPAINGLKGTVYELIPYIVYIGIGVLLMILGFYAIRWLVNWLGGKINSYFNSKRD